MTLSFVDPAPSSQAGRLKHNVMAWARGHKSDWDFSEPCPAAEPPGNHSLKKTPWLTNTCNSCSRPLCSGLRDKYFGKNQVVENPPETDALTLNEVGFIASRDSFYLATLSETGWPYYPHRTRLKLLGHARVLDAREHPDLVDQLAPESLRSKVERLFLIQVISYDWNCPQYITPRFTAAEVEKYAATLKARIAELETQLAARDSPVLEAQR